MVIVVDEKRGEGLETPLPHRRRFDLGRLVFQVDETSGDGSFAVRFENRFGGLGCGRSSAQTEKNRSLRCGFRLTRQCGRSETNILRSRCRTKRLYNGSDQGSLAPFRDVHFSVGQGLLSSRSVRSGFAGRAGRTLECEPDVSRKKPVSPAGFRRRVCATWSDLRHDSCSARIRYAATEGIAQRSSRKENFLSTR